MLYSVLRFLAAIIVQVIFWPKILRYGEIPKSGGALLINNHQSMWDPIILATLTRRKIHFIAKAELYKSKLVGGFLSRLGAYPVKRGQADVAVIRKTIQHLDDGNIVGIYPEGTRKYSGMMGALESGIAMMAYKSNVPVVPVYFEKFRMFKRIKISIGMPVRLEEYRTAKFNREIMDGMMQEITNSFTELGAKFSLPEKTDK